MAVKVTGKVNRLYVNEYGAWIQLDIAPQTGPKGDDFKLRKEHRNYNALYSLALAAAANRWPLQIRIEGEKDINPNDDAVVDYFVVDW